MLASHNQLAAIVADVRALHAGIRRNAEAIARDAIEAGRLLIEAKTALTHGQWETWLRENVAITRTARRYMAVARSGLEIGHVAEMGLSASSKAFGDQRSERIQESGERGWEALVEIGRELRAVRTERGENFFDAWATTTTGFDPKDPAFLIEIADAADTGGFLAVEAVLGAHGQFELTLPGAPDAGREAPS